MAGSGDAIRVLLVEDHEMVGQGLMALLAADPTLEPLGLVSTVADAVARSVRERPAVVLMDYRLPDGNGATATRQIRDGAPDTNVVILTADANHKVLADALDAGACGFVSKDADSRELIAAIRSAATGGSYFTADVLAKLVQLRRDPSVADGSPKLSARERDVLQLTAAGRTPGEIARELHLSLHTVRNHLRRAMSRFDAHTKLEAVVAAARAGLIDIET